MSEILPPNDADSGLTRRERDILWHTEHRAAGGLYCGRCPDVDSLVKKGLMEYAGRKSFVPDEYFKITALGREALRAANWKPQQISPVARCDTDTESREEGKMEVAAPVESPAGEPLYTSREGQGGKP